MNTKKEKERTGVLIILEIVIRSLPSTDTITLNPRKLFKTVPKNPTFMPHRY